MLPELHDGLVGAEAVDNAPLLEIVGGHLHFHAIPGENPHAVEAHATGEMTEELVILRLLRENADAEGGVGEAFLNSAYELDHLFTQSGG